MRNEFAVGEATPAVGSDRTEPSRDDSTCAALAITRSSITGQRLLETDWGQALLLDICSGKEPCTRWCIAAKRFATDSPIVSNPRISDRFRVDCRHLISSSEGTHGQVARQKANVREEGSAEVAQTETCRQESKESQQDVIHCTIRRRAAPCACIPPLRSLEFCCCSVVEQHFQDVRIIPELLDVELSF